MLLPMVIRESLYDPPRFHRKRRVPLFDDALDDMLDTVNLLDGLVTPVVPLIKSKRIERSNGNGSDHQEPEDFRFELNIKGYQPDELQVDIVDNNLVIEGSHVEEDEKNGTLKQKFTRRIPIPENVDRSTIYSEIEGDKLIVGGKPKAVEKTSTRVNIPIGIREKAKEASDTQAVEKEKNPENQSLNNPQ